jgi:hypothetical protein
MIDELAEFLRDLINPEVYGHAVTQEVRDKAYALLKQLAMTGDRG